MESEKKREYIESIKLSIKKRICYVNLIETRNLTVRDKVRNDAKIINDVCWHVITLTYYPSAYI